MSGDLVRDSLELRPGDVVVYAPGDARTVHHTELTPTARFARVSWADGRSSVCDRFRSWTRLHSPTSHPTPRAAPAATPDTTDQEA